MTRWRDLGEIWTILKEIDVRQIRDEADRPVMLAFVGAPGVGKSTLIAALRHPARGRTRVLCPAREAGLNEAARIGNPDLAVLMLDATRDEAAEEQELYARWQQSERNTLVFCNKMDAAVDPDVIHSLLRGWGSARVVLGSATDPGSLGPTFVPGVLEALPDQHLALARHYPLFRPAVGRRLIGDTSIANATYALGTGLGEAFPPLTIPFNVGDIVILTKNQALMAYKLGLAHGGSVRWQDHVTELGGVVGAGFLWRQAARQLVGLIPVWGIVPKVAIAYAGTYTVGEAIMRWYQTGEKLSRRGMQELYSQALARGKHVAQDLLARMPRPAMRRQGGKPVCPRCAQKNPRHTGFCAYCGTPL
jgi:uncharacterized protein (DUF697 family)